MDDVPPEMREQWRLRPTMEAAEEYGGEHPDEFGGLYWGWEPMRVVFLATAHLDQHRRALRDRVAHPDRVEVRRCRYTDRQIFAWLDEVRRRIHDQAHVTGFGPSLGDEGFTVQVTIWPWSEETAERVCNELAPIPVEIDAQPPITLFPHSAPR